MKNKIKLTVVAMVSLVILGASVISCDRAKKSESAADTSVVKVDSVTTPVQKDTTAVSPK